MALCAAVAFAGGIRKCALTSHPALLDHDDRATAVELLVAVAAVGVTTIVAIVTIVIVPIVVEQVGGAVEDELGETCIDTRIMEIAAATANHESCVQMVCLDLTCLPPVSQSAQRES